MKNKKLFILLLLIPIIIFFVGNAYSQEVEIKSVEIQSDGYNTNTPGSFHITKSAEWIANKEAQIEFYVDSILKHDEKKYDIILVIDISESMYGDKFIRAINDALELSDYILDDPDNRVALIVFDTNSSIITNFINDKTEMRNLIDSLDTQGSTNYNAALLNVDTVMNGYSYRNNRDLVTLFLTDGYPNTDSPNQVATYHLLKEKYPYMRICGIQYEMGTDIIYDIIEISDEQWVADQSTLHNVLFEAALNPKKYEKFIVSDYINKDFFVVNSIEDITVDNGTVELVQENGLQKVIWTLNDNFTGFKANMKIKVSLKQELVENDIYYPTNDHETIVYQEKGDEEIQINSPLTPILKGQYKLFYYNNTPSGCSLADIPVEDHLPFDNITMRNDILTCQGYIFKGWQIGKEDKVDIKFVNNNLFIMPNHDVHIYATWTKQDIVKSMEGTVREHQTLYKMMKQEAEDGIYAREYTGSHQDSTDPSKSTKKIYYWYADSTSDGDTRAHEIIENKNNVIFANFCWQIIRTTDTGGVKLLYNGEPLNDQCVPDRGNHVIQSDGMIYTLNDNYWYGTDFVYDKENDLFTLAGDLEQVTWNDESWPNLIDKYTCRSTSSDATCQELNVVDSYYSSTSAKLDRISSTLYRASDYTIAADSKYAVNNTSPAYFGYMYNDVYLKTEYTDYHKEELLHTEWSSVKVFYISDNVSWNPTTKTYSLVNAYRPSSKSAAYGKYTLLSRSSTDSKPILYYIYDNGSEDPYYIPIENGNLEYNNDVYVYGSGIEKTSNGYRIISPRTFTRLNPPVDWYELSHQYLCKNPTDTVDYICDEVWYIQDYSSGLYINYVSTADMMKFSNNFSYENGVYKLTNPVEIWNVTTDKYLFNSNHYTCFNSSGECEQIAYIYTSRDGYERSIPQYVLLSDGKNITDAVNEMFYNDDVNQIDSIAKRNVELWFKHYLINYSDYLEDTVFCYDRRQSNTSTNGWNPNGQLSVPMKFKIDESLYCPNETDRFSITNEKAKLKYPVGILNYYEANMVNNQIIRSTPLSYNYYLFYSPSMFENWAYRKKLASSGQIYDDYESISYSSGLRPVISLRSDVDYIDGDGSMEHPYILDDGTH